MHYRWGISSSPPRRNENTMAKIHFTAQDTTNLTVAQALALRGACGVKTTFTAAIEVTNHKGSVDCQRCIAKMDQPAKETFVQREARQLAEKEAKKAKAARIKEIKTQMAALTAELAALEA